MASPRWLWTVAALALLPSVSPAQPREAGFADVLQTMQACRRLLEDDVLGPLNIGVKVRGRIAVLWGPVPTAELAARAERRLRGMIELIDVRNELIVMPEDLSDVAVPQAPPVPLFLPEKAPPPQANPPRRFLRRDLGEAGAVQLAGAPAARASDQGLMVTE